MFKISNLDSQQSIRRRRMFAAKLGTLIPPAEAFVLTGTVIDGSSSVLNTCNETVWQIEETASGIETRFTFEIEGTAKKIKIKGRKSFSDIDVQAWNGSSWDTLYTIPSSAELQTYTISLGSQYTINNQVKVRVLQTNQGGNDTIYLDCIYIVASSSDPYAARLIPEAVGYYGNQGVAPIITWHELNEWEVGDAGGGSWSYALWKANKLTDNFGVGRLRITLYCVSGSIYVKFGPPEDADHGNHSPPLSSGSDTLGAISAGQTLVGLGGAPFTFQDGYFALDTGWGAPYSARLRITKLEWYDGSFHQIFP